MNDTMQNQKVKKLRRFLISDIFDLTHLTGSGDQTHALRIVSISNVYAAVTGVHRRTTLSQRR